MIKLLKPPSAMLLRPEVDRLVEEFGRRDVLRAAIGAVLRRRSPPMEAGGLSAHVRRDIGLPPVDVPRDWRLLR